MIDMILDFVYDMLYQAIDLLPDSPFASMLSAFEDSGFQNIMNYINFFIPVGPMLGILTAYVACVAIWYVARYLLKLAQYI